MAKPVHPCPRCGYHAAELPCPHCELSAGSPEWKRLRPRAGPALGLEAFVRGGGLVMSVPGGLRMLAMPAAMTAFGAVLVYRNWVSGWVASLFAGLEPAAVAARPEGWLRSTLGFFSNSWFVELLSRASHLVAMTLTAWLAFTFLFEAIAGPFLDRLHGRLEKRWFGKDPSAKGLGLTGTLRREGHMLSLSIAAAGMAALVSLLALPLLLFPGIGSLLYLAVSGIALSLGAMDTAFARRGWSLRQRKLLFERHWMAAASFGALAGAISGFPFLGPLVMVPCASLGGLWMLVRVDKSPARIEPGAGAS
ncbi:MAG: hypothetical protein ACI8QC_003036 [Planctomycetota bacterium]|jgi:uncharacterized protein involved in cysteine biosynthesis